jgi:YidC/Oxa1 family membrane protein insertase
MERRLTAFLLPLLVLVLGYVLLFRKTPEAPPDEPPLASMPSASATQTPPPVIGERPADSVFEKRFGEIGQPGSFHVVFDRQGGSVRSVYLLDEPATPDARRKSMAEWTLEDTYAAVRPVQRGVVALSLGERGARRFGVNLEQAWELEDLADGVAFTLHDPKTGLSLRRTYTHRPGSRELDLTVALVADADRPAGQADLPAGSDASLVMYGLGLVNPAVDFILGTNPAIALASMVDRNTKQAAAPNVLHVDGKPNPEKLPAFGYHSTQVEIDFAGTTNRFFGAFLHPANEEAREGTWRVEMEKWPRKVTTVAADANDDTALDQDPFTVPVANYFMLLKVPEAGATTELAYRLYLGPKSSAVFDEDPDLARYQAVMDVDLSPAMCFCDIPGARFMAKALLSGLRGLHSLVGSWGLAIVLLTLIVRGSLVPLNFRMQKSMRAFGAKVARLKPEQDAIKERYAKDPKRMQQEMLAFQRKHKLFPPLGGCLPLFVTIPVFLGLFTALRVAYELRCEPFIGWIDDLSRPDRLAELGFWPHHLNVLPILMVVLWFILQSGTPLPTDPQQRQVMKIMRFMPFLFGVMLYNYAAGLMVYMVTSSALGIIEQRVTRKILGPPPAEAATAMPTF